MDEPFLGSLGIVGFNFAPRGWAFCNGQLLPINQNQALFALLGTQYGGNGTTTFALPNLQGRAAMHVGNNFTQGEVVGQNSQTLSVANLPSHTHTLSYAPPCSTAAATSSDPTNNVPATTAVNSYSSPATVNLGYTAQGGATISTANAGGNQPVSVMQPYLVLNFCIALQGIFPSRN
ncbi:phage tail protein [Spirosoma spitsbergense]|uniref:phage tail protein n=1 Tax=Spirosoma spitsbergense TaxID=431554 RepID=UPI000377C4FE|nr:tail fiber protein [Spirosoma spitsbergense]